MRTLLIIPPFYRMLGGRNNWVHLGVGYLSSMLHQNGIEVKVYNTDYVEDGKDLNLRDVFRGKSIYDEIINDTSHPLWQEIMGEIEAYNPDIIGFTINFTMTAKIVERLASLVKSWNPGIKVIVGGPHVTILSEFTLRHECFDYAIRYEGEYTLLDIVQGKNIKEIEGVSYRDSNGKICENPDRALIQNLDDLPFPDINLQLKKVTNPLDNFGVIATSRGCSLKCTFCSSPSIWNKSVRFRSVDNVINEIKSRYFGYGVRKYYFSDDNFNINKKYTLDLCNQIIVNKLDIEWICEAQLKAFNREILEAMKAAGCKRVKLGIESGNNRILKLMKKNTTKEEIRNVVKLVKEVGIEITAYFLIGMPTETRDEMLETYDFAEELDLAYLSLSIASPQYGTPLFSTMQDMGVPFTVEDWLEHFHQSYKTVLNDEVTEDIIEKFLNYNENKGFTRTI